MVAWWSHESCFLVISIFVYGSTEDFISAGGPYAHASVVALMLLYRRGSLFNLVLCFWQLIVSGNKNISPLLKEVNPFAELTGIGTALVRAKQS